MLEYDEGMYYMKLLYLELTLFKKLKMKKPTSILYVDSIY